MSILDNAKEVAKAVHEINNLDLYQRVLNLHSDIVALVEDNIHLREENKELTKTIALHKQMHFTEPFYYQEGDKTPFCSSCWETKKVAVHVNLIYDGDEETRWDCPSCKYMYLIKKGTPRVSAGYSGASGPNSWMAR